MGGRTTVLAPTDTTTDTTPAFNWAPVDGSAHYDLWVNREDVPTNGIINETELEGTSYTPTTPLPIGTYRVWVRAVSTTAETGVWSAPAEFTISLAANDRELSPGRALVAELALLEAETPTVNDEQSQTSRYVSTKSQTKSNSSDSFGDRGSDEDFEREGKRLSIVLPKRDTSHEARSELSQFFKHEEVNVDAVMSTLELMDF